MADDDLAMTIPRVFSENSRAKNDHQSLDPFNPWGEMRDDNTEILFKSGLRCAAESN
ncbi:hypothetical protein DPMN_121918 [Dreissena polymorpha]|uniref:Uncharacterized protein n=1 Tax=Dreissena polymorpha TaxID=45954 RepID=A0A9D4JRH7_DREPO|nr:hypothetical protein DPMN_121918 [Dreissena polymorpha]